MGDKKSKKNNAAVVDAAQMPHWSGSQFSFVPPPPIEHSNKKILSFGSSNKIVTMSEGTIQSVEHDDLKQGSLYIVKIRNVSVALFQGWDDDMCCFAVLRSDSTPMRWSEARYIPGDFDAYDAFDDAGNPPVHLWSRHLRVNVPINWFSIFEEARRKQRSWMNEQNDDYYYPAEQPETAGHSGRHTKGIKASPVTPPPTDKSSANQTPAASEIDEGDQASIENCEDQDETPSADNEESNVKGSTGGGTEADNDQNETPIPEPTTAPVAISNTKSIRKPSASTSVSASTSADPRPSKSEITAERALAKKGVAVLAVNSPKHEAPTTLHSKSTPRESASHLGQDAQRYHHHQNQQEQHQIAAPKYLSTPPTSPVNMTPVHPKGHQPIYQPQMADKHNNLFASADFAFPHNETQFSIQGNNFSDSPMQNSAPGKTMAHVLDAPTKSKRRSMQGFFRK
ncbi:hypothetical protein BX666DRAFT_2025414 [Dichotomocladium elegans]|nr:hypothetical protein BX666DRAFT_2025414 [Dichotomocladium elegans]